MNNDRNLRTHTSRLLMALPIAAVAFSLAACSAPAERPAPEDLAVGFQKIMSDNGQPDAFTDEEALCISEALVESEVSDQDLATLASGKDEQSSIEARDLVSQVTLDARVECTGR